ncbi:MAG: hypothetical protein ACYC3I_04210 [Gemmataceae bacterium]
MAFHPFKHFRKHQKVYLAIVTILTMFIFIFTGFASRGADPVTRLLIWIGGGRHGDPVLPLYGKTVYSDELDKLRWQRQLASEFLLYDVFTTAANDIPLQKSLTEIQKRYIQKKGGNDLPTPLQIAFEQMEDSVRQVGAFPPDMRLQPLRNGLAFIQSQLRKPDVQSNPEQYRPLDAMATNLALQAWLIDPQRRPNDSYFGGSVRAADLLDFLIWKEQADRLGIVLTPADVCREVNRAWGNGDYLPADGKLEGNEWVNVFFRSNPKIHKSLTPHDLLGALTDEFRVLMAKEALLGAISGVRGYREAVDGIHISPAAATPDEFYKYFQEQRTTLSVSLLPVAVDGFMAEAKKKWTPTETDLRNLYARYKDDEPSPTRRQPGFKEPRRIKIEYFSYQPEGPFARQLAAKAIELLPIFRIGQPAAPFAAGGGMAWAASFAGYADLDTAIRSLYEKYREEEARRVTIKYDREDSSRFGLAIDLFNQREVEAQAAAATLGQLLGDLNTGGTPLGGPIDWLAANELAQRATLTAYASSVLAAASSSPIAAAVLPMRYRHTPQPFDAVREQMIDRFQNALAKKIMDDRIQNLRKDLDKVLAGHSEDKLAEFMKKALADYGIENVHLMKEAQTRQEILDDPDPALQRLHQAYDESVENPFVSFSFGPQEARPDFVAALFHDFEPTMQERQIDQILKRERPWRTRQFHTLAGDKVWVFWRAEDKQAHVRPFETIRAEVEKAWYFEQARKLAREKAQQINEDLKKQNLDSPEVAVRFLVQQGLGSVFQLDKVSHLTTPDFNLPGQAQFHGSYRQYVPPREFVPYPPSDFVAQLLKLKKRGDSLVLADKPVKHFYVAVLMENPQLPERREFLDVYNLPNIDNHNLFPNLDEPLWYQMMADRQRKYAQKLLEQLRAEATTDLQGGEYVLPDSIRNRSESSRDFGE